MKTAVSLPDDLFRLAEKTARRLPTSRSELYAKAIREYLKQPDINSVTELLNEIYSRHSASIDPALHRAQVKSLEKDGWEWSQCCEARSDKHLWAGDKRR